MCQCHLPPVRGSRYAGCESMLSVGFSEDEQVLCRIRRWRLFGRAWYNHLHIPAHPDVIGRIALHIAYGIAYCFGRHGLDVCRIFSGSAGPCCSTVMTSPLLRTNQGLAQSILGCLHGFFEMTGEGHTKTAALSSINLSTPQGLSALCNGSMENRPSIPLIYVNVRWSQGCEFVHPPYTILEAPMWTAQQSSTNPERPPTRQNSREIVLEFAAAQRLRTYRPRQLVLSQGDCTAHVLIVISGWAEQAIQFADGRRQVVAFAMPGDLCCNDLTSRAPMEQSITAVTTLTVSIVGKLEFRALLTGNARLARSFWRNQMLSLSIQRRWTSVIGQMGAKERVAHLLCEIYLRQEKIGMASHGVCPFPVTQTQIAEACGLTQVHTNRVIQELRRSGLIELRSKRLTLPSLAAIMAIAQFEGAYLDLEDPDPAPTKPASRRLEA